MATWADKMTEIKERRRAEAIANDRRNALNQIFQESFEPGQTIETPMYGPTQTGEALPPAVEQSPGRMNEQNALNLMYQRGFFPEALQYEQRLIEKNQVRGPRASGIANIQRTKHPKTGKWVYGIPGEDNILRFMRTEGGSIAEAPTWEPYKRARDAAQGKEHGTAQGEAQTQLAGVEMDVSELKRLSAELLAHPGRKWAIGPQGIVPGAPGTAHGDFVGRFDQIKAMAFKSAYETLKGGGQITEYESKTAAQALNRMDRARTQQEFESAVTDFIRVYEIGFEKIRNKAEGKFSVPSGVSPKGTSTNTKKAIKAGDIINTRRGRVLVEKINPDGSYEGKPVK